jgi:small-conductance mechanosensitive channel
MDIEKEIQLIKDRNKRVEADKAWEVSILRKILILLVTYIIASLALYYIGTPRFYLGSIIPTVGFFLSTLGFPVVKKWWVKRYFDK